MNQFEEVPPGARLPGLPVGGWGSRVSRSAAASRATEGPRVDWHVCVVERSAVRREQYKSAQLNRLLVSYMPLAHAGLTISLYEAPLAILSLHLSCEIPLSSSS